LVRENRLYQADWLLRFYGFQHHELTTTDTPNLDLHLDPKTSWALRSRNFFPVDINKAPREDLLRVPGLGVRTVDRILKMRPHRSITLADLAKLRVSLDKARPFILTADKNAAVTLLDDQKLEAQLLPKKPKQPTLFELMGESAEGW
jgi:predicted DNA-binding helix-hairpin-helix protein